MQLIQKHWSRLSVVSLMLSALAACSSGGNQVSSLSPTTTTSSSGASSKIFIGDPDTVTQPDLGLAFGFFTLGGTPTAAELIARANLLLPGTTLDIPASTVLTPPTPTLANFKALADGGTTLTQQDLGIFFAAFTLLQGATDPGSVVLTSAALCERANLLLPGTSLDIPAAQCSLVRDPRTLGVDPNTQSSLIVSIEGPGGLPVAVTGQPLDVLINATYPQGNPGVPAGGILEFTLTANLQLIATIPGQSPQSFTFGVNLGAEINLESFAASCKPDLPVPTPVDGYTEEHICQFSQAFTFPALDTFLAQLPPGLVGTATIELGPDSSAVVAVDASQFGIDINPVQTVEVPVCTDATSPDCPINQPTPSPSPTP